MLFKAVKFLEGKKSYIVAFSTIGYGAYQAFVASNGNWKVFTSYLFSGSFMMTIRAAVAKMSVVPVGK